MLTRRLALALALLCVLAEPAHATGNHFFKMFRVLPGPALTPGAGWTGPTPIPANQGSAATAQYSLNPIGNWDTEQFQTFTGDFNKLCVVAAHQPTDAEYSGHTSAWLTAHFGNIDHVDIAVAGGAWVSISTPIFNANHNVIEFCANTRARDYADGVAREARARIWPTTGVVRVLQGDPQQAAGSFTGSISGTTLTVTAGSVSPGAILTGMLVPYDTEVISSDLGGGTYTVSQSATVPSETITATYQRPDNAYSLWFSTNFGGTLPALTEYVSPSGSDLAACTVGVPCLTLSRARTKLKADAAAAGMGTEAGGSVIYMAPGNYAWPTPSADTGLAAQNRWIEFRQTPGTVGAVNINSAVAVGTPRLEKVRLVGINVLPDDITAGNGMKNGVTTVGGRGVMLWLDHVHMTIPTILGGINYDTQPAKISNWPGAIIVTDTEISGYGNAITDTYLSRNEFVHDIASDAFTGSKVLINAIVEGILKPSCVVGPNTCNAHPDVLQLTGAASRTLFTGSINGTTMTVTAVNSSNKDPILAGQQVTTPSNGTPPALNTLIVTQLTSAELDGSLGKTGTYQVSVSQIVASKSLMGVVQFFNRIAYGVTAINQINSQCYFPNNTGLRDLALINYRCNNSYNTGRYTYQDPGAYVRNLFMLDSAWNGGLIGFRGVDEDVRLVNTTCATTIPHPVPAATGVTKKGGTC